MVLGDFVKVGFVVVVAVKFKKMSGKILWVNKQPPWSRWVYSGGSQALCVELKKRSVLHGALAPDFISRTFSQKPILGMEFLFKLKDRVPWVFPRDECWDCESDGSLGRALKSLPPGSAVVYVFDMPRVAEKFNVKRYLFLDLSAYEGRRAQAFGIGELSDQEFDLLCQHQREMLSQVDGVLTPSTFAADSISRDFDFPREKITAFGCGAALPERISEVACDGAAVPNVLFVGRDWNRKGGPMVHKAWQLLRQRIPNVTLTIIGPTVQPVAEPGVQFIGFLDKTSRAGLERLRSEFQKASAFCMPTLCEPWGLVFVEAMIFGAPVVSFDAWSLPDIVEDGVTGFLVKKHDAEALCDALYRVIADRELASRMKQFAFHRATSVLSWQCCADRLLARVLPKSIEGKGIQWMQPRERDYLGIHSR